MTATAGIRGECRLVRWRGLGAAVVVTVVVVLGFDRGGRRLQWHQRAMTKSERHERRHGQSQDHAQPEQGLHTTDTSKRLDRG